MAGLKYFSPGVRWLGTVRSNTGAADPLTRPLIDTG